MSEPRSSATGARVPLFLHCIGLLTLAAIAGCGDRLPRVTGQVLLDGDVVLGASDLRCILLFYPESGSGTPAVAVVDRSGHYSLDTGSKKGAKAGKYNVAVTITQLSQPGDEGGLPGRKRLSPRKYADPLTSGLKIEVVPGSNEFDFALESDSSTKK